jgi:phosphatidylserine decarboxylase
MPLDGRLRSTIHVPGRLFSVNPTTAAAVPGLFARNERVVCLFDTALGPMILVLVGAIFVGSIETIWSGRITPPRARKIVSTQAGDDLPPLRRGAEFGRFNMGSTVILLMPAGSVRWKTGLAAGDMIRCGNALALPQGG